MSAFNRQILHISSYQVVPYYFTSLVATEVEKKHDRERVFATWKPRSIESIYEAFGDIENARTKPAAAKERFTLNKIAQSLLL